MGARIRNDGFVDHLIDEIMKSMKLEEGRDIVFSPIMRFQDLSPVLVDCCDLDINIDSSDKRKIVLESLYHMKRTQRSGRDALLKEISDRQSKFLSVVPKKYYLLTKIWAPRVPGDSNSFVFRGVRVRIEDIFSRKCDLSPFWFNGQGDIDIGKRDKYSALTASVSARSAKEAARRVLDVLSIYVATINFVLQGRTRRLTLGDYTPFSAARLGQYHVVYNDNLSRHEDNIWYDPFFDIAKTQNFSVRDKELYDRDVVSLMKKIERLAISDVIWDALRQVDKGGQNPDQEIALMYTWSALENATGSANGQEVARRAAFFSTEPQLRRARLQYISKIRNKIVHKGDGDWGESGAVEELRYYSYAFLRALISMGGIFRTKNELFEFLNYPVEFVNLQRRVHLTKKALKLLKS